LRKVFLLLLVLLALAVNAGAGETVNRIAAVVDNQVITVFEIEQMALPVIAQAAQQKPNMSEAEKQITAAQIKQQLLDTIIEQKLIENEVARLGIEVTDQEIDTYAERVKKENSLTDETLNIALSRQGLTMQDFRDRLKKEIMREQYVSFRMRDKLRVRDEDVRSYYKLHPDEFAAEPVVKIAELRLNVPPDADEAALQAAFARINGLYERLLAGADFAELARENSQGPPAADGGMLGEFKLDTELQDVYRKAVLPLEPGQVSTIYRDRNGFAILKLVEKKMGNVLPYSQVKEKIRSILRREQADREMERLAAELRRKSFVDIRVNFQKASE